MSWPVRHGSFATGTSWGSFGILLPIAGQIMTEVGSPDLLLPALAAVLGGAVVGDHVSPISDTTILSSTGAGPNLMDHVLTQLGGRTAAQAIEDGVEPRDVWRALCADFDVPRDEW